MLHSDSSSGARCDFRWADNLLIHIRIYFRVDHEAKYEENFNLQVYIVLFEIDHMSSISIVLQYPIPQKKTFLLSSYPALLSLYSAQAYVTYASTPLFLLFLGYSNSHYYRTRATKTSPPNCRKIPYLVIYVEFQITARSLEELPPIEMFPHIFLQINLVYS